MPSVFLLPIIIVCLVSVLVSSKAELYPLNGRVFEEAAIQNSFEICLFLWLTTNDTQQQPFIYMRCPLVYLNSSKQSSVKSKTSWKKIFLNFNLIIMSPMKLYSLTPVYRIGFVSDESAHA